MPDERDDAVRARFGAQADLIASYQDARATELEERVHAFVLPGGDERALDVGTGTGALALALAPHVREVVGVDIVPELLEQARARAAAHANVTFVEGDAVHLDFETGSFDLVGTLRTLHHVPRPEYVVSEIVRVTRPGGRVLVIDQIAPSDPLAALELDRFERARDPTHTRLLPDTDFRGLFDANELVLRRTRFLQERRPLDPYFDLAGCEGEARERARGLAPQGPDAYTATVAWYLLDKRPLGR
jgi:ubiquinone/menaquinone biosynthesis C-methylase UbiE